MQVREPLDSAGNRSTPVLTFSQFSATNAPMPVATSPAVEGRRLRYSERKQLSETGSLGDFAHDEVPPALITAVIHFYERAGSTGAGAGAKFRRAVLDESIAHWSHVILGSEVEHAYLANPEMMLDMCETLVEEGTRVHAYWVRNDARRVRAWPNAEADLNRLFERNRFGFRMEGGEARKISSPALEATVVGPALLAVQRPGWEEVEKTFRESLDHQRAAAEENDDALTTAHAALEAAMKAAGLKGTHLSQLAKSFQNSQLVPSQLVGVPGLLDDLLKRSGAVRDQHGDAHGKAPGADAVPQALVDLAIHWTGAFIVYLAEATS